MEKNPHAVALGTMGGRITSKRKAEAARKNGKKGGHPIGMKNQRKSPLVVASPIQELVNNEKT